jgi:uncharacterized membrane protein YesL
MHASAKFKLECIYKFNLKKSNFIKLSFIIIITHPNLKIVLLIKVRFKYDIC